MTDLKLAFEAIFGPQDWDQPREWDGFIPDEPDLYVSESEARHRQQQYDNWLERDAS